MDNLKGAKEALKFAVYDGQELTDSFWLNQNKILMGSSTQSDITLQDRHISHYHALITVADDGVSVSDLGSRNGIFVNGERVTSKELLVGDILRVGAIDLFLEEGVQLDEKGVTPHFKDLDGNVVDYVDQLLNENIVAVPSKKNLVLIDDEYCDIQFEQPELELATDLPLEVDQLSLQGYQDFGEVKQQRDLVKPQVGSALELSLVSNGVMISMDFLTLQQSEYFVTPERKPFSKDVTLPLVSQRTKLLERRDEQLILHQLEGFNLSIGGRACQESEVILAVDDLAIWQLGSAQIMLRQVDAPPSLKGVPFWGRDKQFYRQLVQVVASIMGLMLLLLFVDIDNIPKEPERKLAVIYRIKSKTNLEVKNSTPSSGEQSEMKKVAKVTPKKVEPPKVKKVVTKSAPKRSARKLATKTKVAPKVVVKKKVKRYRFKLDNSLASLARKSVLPKKVKIAAKRRIASVNPLGVNSSELSDDRSLSNQQV